MRRSPSPTLLALLTVASMAALTSPAAAQSPADPAAAWGTWLMEHLAPGASITVETTPASSSTLTCGDLSSPDVAFMTYPADRFEALKARLAADPRGFRNACAALEYESWSVVARVSTDRPQTFSDVTVSVRPAPEGRSAADHLAAAAQLGVEASKSGQLIVPVGDTLVTLTVPCSAGDLFVYEAGDLLAALAAGSPGGSPGAELVYSPCGQMHLDLRSTAEIREDAATTRSLWGKPFPATRDEFRNRPANR